MPSTRPTIRLTPALAAQVAARLGPGLTVSDVVRQALEVFLGTCPTRPTSTPTLSDVSDVSDTLTALAARLATLERAVDVAPWLTDLQRRLTHLQQAVDLVADLADQRARLTALEQALGALRQETAAGLGQLEQQAPAFDQAKYALGRLCERSHDYHGTGQTLRWRHNGNCVQCQNQTRKARRAAQRHGPRAAPEEAAP